MMPVALLNTLREKFDALLIAEVNHYGGIPDWLSLPCGREQLELREAIAAVLLATDTTREVSS
jgi:hypothetical protein